MTTANLLSIVKNVESAISDADFFLFQRVILADAGIRLNQTKKALLVGRLWKRINELGLTTFRQYYLRIQDDPRERVRMIDLITTNETSFFREPRQFALLEERIIPMWIEQAAAGQRPPRIRVWSAGCSTGEEPYSIAAMLATLCPDFHIEILATDISTRALRTASEGVWPREKAGAIPQRYLARHFLEGFGAQIGKIRARDSLRQLIRFRRVNLQDPAYRSGAFDLVFCRNVLIYFDPDTRRQVVNRLLDHCETGGYLFLGHSETLSAHSSRLRLVEAAVGVKR